MPGTNPDPGLSHPGPPDPPQRCERGRVAIIRHDLVADNGYPLIGERDYALTETKISWFDLASKFHLNTIRIYLYQEPLFYDGGCGWDCSGIPTAEESIPYIDRLVDEAARNGFYIIIDYHPVGGLDIDHARKWWTVIAPRYKDRTHVIYELANEPVSWFPEDYSSRDIAAQEELYTLVRSLAPETHLILWSFPNATGGMFEKVHQGDKIDYQNASVGYHPYQFDENAISQLRSAYPVINTEIGGLSLEEYTSRTEWAIGAGGSWIWLDGVNWPLKVTWPPDPEAIACAGPGRNVDRYFFPIAMIVKK